MLADGGRNLIFDEAKQVMETFQSDIYSDVADTLTTFWPIVVIVIGGLLAFIIVEEIIDLINYRRWGYYEQQEEYEDD